MRNGTPFVAGISSVLVVALLFIVFEYVEGQRYREALHAPSMSQLSQVRAELEAGINANFFLTRGLIAYVSAYSDIGRETFHRIADTLLRTHNFIRNIALAPNNILSFVHPLKGNEKALGLNY